MYQSKPTSFHYIAIYKLSLCVLAMALMFISLLPAEAAAATGIVTGSVVNVRSSPDRNAEIAGTVLKDTEVEIKALSGDWYQVKYGALQGYVARDLIAARLQVQIKNGPVNGRSGPGTNYDIIASLGDKIIFTVLGEQNDWYQIRLPDGNLAYVASWLTTPLNTAGAAGATVVSPSPPTTPAVPGTANPAHPGTAAPAAPTAPTAEVTAPANPTVFLNSNRLQFEVEPRIENGRTLVPLRAIFEAMGASVAWDEATRTVTARRGATTVILPIGSTSPTVNGQVWNLDVPAKIVNDRTLAPLRFVGEAFGGTVAWNEQTREINIACTALEVPKAVLIAGDSVNLRETPSADGAIIDVAREGEKMTVLAEKNSWYQVSRGGRNVWVASWVVNPLSEAITDSSGNSKPNSNPQPAPQPGNIEVENPVPVPDSADINRRGDENAVVAKGSIAISTRLADDGYRLVMKTAEAAEPNITVSEDGKKVTYTFKKVALKANRDEAYFYIGSGKNAQTTISAQTLEDTTWVTIEMPRPYQYIDTVEADGCKHVFTIYSQLTAVEEMELKNGNQIIVLRATSAMEYEESSREGLITLNLNKTGLGQVQRSYLFSGLAGQVSLEENSKNRSLQVKIATGSNLDTYQVNRSLDGQKISVILVNKVIKEEAPANQSGANSKVTVMLDPGHGGKDSGAISKSRTLMEKDVVLSIGLKTRDILEKAGYKVLMTREDDTYVGLSERPALANQARADLFVSIHCDSVESTEPHGTGTFYYAPESNASLYAQEYQRSLLADLLQKAMVEKCGRTDRRVRQANYAVLRESSMPSALVETAFISNAEEAGLLASADFQTKAAQAIAEGIQKYIKLML